ncbi:hypothetical protein C1752_00822 [Acaryochloris thomasi RCC1774]|uniref:Uncharacterized protein n=1 Tax=Acaryochloris thomasi RCC1774 TaxID=1764569 RepID=A0A2W1JMT0_9CYAN|nr:hypothetical protein [Acaryochloris thomasi]PZD74589.1 hypothetical protein C1752_00822 [Acaryochloris thomasi RCC1774]
MLVAIIFAFVTGVSIEAMAAEDAGVGIFSKLQASRNVEIFEVSPPEVIQELRSLLSSRQPQVEILSPRADQVVEDRTVSVDLQVEGLPIFKNAELGLGPHLRLFVDDQPGQAIYDLLEPVTLGKLKPGTHTLRVLAVYPWFESFKNQGAYAEVTFHVFTKTRDNQPTSTHPLLTYNQPQDFLGAEPVLLDFYVSGLPKSETGSDRQSDVFPGQVRVTVNDNSFLIPGWKSLYLEGLHSGTNWVRLELLDEKGVAIANTYNETVRLVDLQSDGQDSLAQIVRGDLTTSQAQGIVDPDYRPAPIVEVAAPEPTVDELPELDSIESGAAEPSEKTPALTPEQPDLPASVVEIDEQEATPPEVTPPEKPDSLPERVTTTPLETEASGDLDAITE